MSENWCRADSRFIAFFDECGDHSLEKIDPDFPLFVLALVVAERRSYRDCILPSFNAFKLKFFNHEGVNLHSRDIRRSQGPFLVLRNQTLRHPFIVELGDIVNAAPFTLFVTIIRKQDHLDRHKNSAANPYDLALEFTMDCLVRFLDAAGETNLPIVAEARGKLGDNMLEKEFYRIFALGTSATPAESFKRLHCSLSFQPKANNIIGIQLADLCAYPRARQVLHPAKPNPAYEIVKQKIYCGEGVGGWRIFP